MDWVGPAAFFLAGALLGWKAPTAALLAALIASPIRLEVLGEVNPATALLCGAVLGRAPVIVAVLRAEPALFFATIAVPLWILVSAAWAWQPAFVFGLAGKWFTVALAAWLAAADRTREPRVLVMGALVAMIPHALWGLAERLHLIAPLGDPRVLVNRAIDFMGNIRGRALFWHPNRLGEFLEQIGLFVVAAGSAGILPWFCLLGFLAALAGVWGTGSMGSLGTLAGGSFLVAAWVALDRRGADRLGRWLVWGTAAFAATGIVAWAYWAHDGLGPRGIVFRFAWEQIAENPWLGIGGGNWSLAVGRAHLDISRFWFRGHAHSLPLHVWAELGVLGLILVAAFFLVPIGSAFRRYRAISLPWRGVGVGASAAVLALLAHNFVHYFLRDAADGIPTGLLLGLAVAAARRGGDGHTTPDVVRTEVIS